MTFNIPNSNGSTFRSNVNSALNTLQGEIGSGGGGYNHQFTANQLVDKQITITHGLNKQFPYFKFYSNGISLSDTSYTAIATDANNLQLTIPSPPTP
jgi:hypothetical protein